MITELFVGRMEALENKVSELFPNRKSHFNPILGSLSMRLFFENSYEGSVIIGPDTYGGSQGLFELAVYYKGEFDYTTPITQDVVGHLTEDEVVDLLKQIEQLPKK